MRVVPKDIHKWLKQHDDELSIYWSDQYECWYFAWKGVDLFAYRHLDENHTMAITIDGCLAEIQEIIHKADLHRMQKDAVLLMDLRRAERLENQRKEIEADQAECREESKRVVDTFRRGGPKPFSLIQNNTTTKKERVPC